jgi:pimeloyl-ACP methyl ester carboxylesterase
VLRDVCPRSRPPPAAFAALRVVRESRQFTGEWAFPLAAVDCTVRRWHGEHDANAPVDGARRVVDALPDCERSVLADTDHLGALVESRERVLDRWARDA